VSLECLPHYHPKTTPPADDNSRCVHLPVLLKARGLHLHIGILLEHILKQLLCLSPLRKSSELPHSRPTIRDPTYWVRQNPQPVTTYTSWPTIPPSRWTIDMFPEVSRLPEAADTTSIPEHRLAPSLLPLSMRAGILHIVAAWTPHGSQVSATKHNL
jgi:hypothetical protein